MLIPLPCLSRRAVKRLGVGRWRAQDADPQFLFRPALTGASYLLIECAAQDSLLDPCFFVDEGEGFDPAAEIGLRETVRGLYIVDIRSFKSVRRLRFDPASDPLDFSLRAYVVFTAAAARHCAARWLGRAQAPGLANRRSTFEIVVGSGVATLADLGARAAKPLGPNEYFHQVVAMAGLEERRRGQIDAAPIAETPKLSFVAPVYNAPAAYLDDLLHSFQIQTPDVWELLLCDDASEAAPTRAWLEAHANTPGVRVLRNPRNGGIASATNLGVAAARGEWVGLIDHDDALAPFALAQILTALEKRPDAAFLYTDEIVTDARLRPQGCFCKPAYDPVLLSGVNYINHLSLYRRARLCEISGLRRGFDGSQDYDLLLRYLKDLPEDKILHLPYPAYLWRRDGGSYSAQFLQKATQAARRALSEAYFGSPAGQIETSAPIPPPLVVGALNDDLHRLRFDRRRTVWPPITVIIPNKDAYPLISRLLEDLTERTDYPDFDIVIVDNGSSDPRTLDLYDRMQKGKIPFKADIAPGPFNFSAQINRGLKRTRGAALLLNNDIQVIEPGWLKEMACCLDYSRAGIVGARLLYPNGALQHAGVIVGLGGVAGHWHVTRPADEPGPMGRLRVRQSFSAVTGACMLVSGPCLQATGLLDEEKFAIAYNDVDYCLRATAQGFRTLWTPFATLCHHESATRGSDETPANRVRFRGEQDALRQAYDVSNFQDPAYNPWWRRDMSLPRLSRLEHLPQARAWPVIPPAIKGLQK